MQDRQRLALFLLAAAGSLTSHALAYLAVTGGVFAGAAHGHVGLMTAVVMPVAAAVLAWLAVTSARHVDLGSVINVRRLTAAQAVVFLVQESLEVLSLGAPLSSALHNPAILLGLVLQPVVGLVLILLLRTATQLAASLLASDPTFTARTGRAPRRSIHQLVPVGAPLGAPAGRRGPPVVFVNS